MEAPAFGWDTGIANATPVGDSCMEPHIAVSVTVFGLGQRASSKAELFGRGRSDKSRVAQARAEGLIVIEMAEAALFAVGALALAMEAADFAGA